MNHINNINRFLGIRLKIVESNRNISYQIPSKVFIHSLRISEKKDIKIVLSYETLK